MGKKKFEITRENFKNRKNLYKIWEVAGHFELFEGRGQ